MNTVVNGAEVSGVFDKYFIQTLYRLFLPMRCESNNKRELEMPLCIFCSRLEHSA
jgi:hypothetical protein